MIIIDLLLVSLVLAIVTGKVLRAIGAREERSWRIDGVIVGGGAGGVGGTGNAFPVPAGRDDPAD